MGEDIDFEDVLELVSDKRRLEWAWENGEQSPPINTAFDPGVHATTANDGFSYAEGQVAKVSVERKQLGWGMLEWGRLEWAWDNVFLRKTAHSSNLDCVRILRSFDGTAGIVRDRAEYAAFRDGKRDAIIEAARASFMHHTERVSL